MSTYAGPEPLGKARRWDKLKKEYINIDQPNIIKEYNASMGGVDMLDAHPIRTRRWYMILFWHFLSVAVINAWLLYQRDCEAQGIPTSKVLKLRKFQGLVAEGLFQVGTARSRGRPTTSGLSSPPPQKFVRVYRLCTDVLCARTSKLKCTVKNVLFHSASTKKRNCFKDYYNV